MLKIINSRIQIAILLLLPVLALLQSCQDDPELAPVNDGVPVITPKSKASLTLIQLNSFPQTDPSGATWDAVNIAEQDTFGAADIFFNITIPEPQPPVLWSQLSHFLNIMEPDTTPFVLLTPYEVVPFGSSIDINIYDYEVTPSLPLPDSTLMGTVNFVIDEFPDPLNPYPSYVTSEQNGFSVTIGIKWED